MKKKKMTGIICNFLEFSDSALKVSGVHSAKRVFNQQLTRPEGGMEEEEEEEEEGGGGGGDLFECTERTRSGQKLHVPLLCQGQYYFNV
jgi:hypothetical protein